jgi:site-specific recombinase XerD
MDNCALMMTWPTFKAVILAGFLAGAHIALCSLGKGATMSQLRAKMIEQMQLHRKAPGTQSQDIDAIYRLTAYYRRSPDQLSSQEIRHYLHHLLVERQLAWSTCNVVAAAIRFFYVDTLGWTPFDLNLPPRTAPKRLPQVLSVEQLERLFSATLNAKHRAVLMTTYAAGLRVSEVVRLQVHDIESDPSRMLIRIHQGKGHKDRYSLLSERLLVELRAYLLEDRAASALAVPRVQKQPSHGQWHGPENLQSSPTTRRPRARLRYPHFAPFVQHPLIRRGC